jgi:hypothetical protein
VERMIGSTASQAIFLAWLTFSIVACATSSVVKSPGVGGGTISLQEAQPTPGSPLSPGSRVTFRVSAAYRLSAAPTGFIVLVFQDDAAHLLYPGEDQTRVDVKGADGLIEISQTITIPPGIAAIHLHLELTRFRGHPGRGVYGCHGATEATGVHEGVQG